MNDNIKLWHGDCLELMNDRDYLCFEKEKEYFDIAEKRIKLEKSQLTLF